MITGRGGAVGDLLVTHPRIKMVTFTGSVPVGLGIKEKAGLKRVTLELGSNAAVIVEDTEDLDVVAARCVEGSFNFVGQVCISVQRIFVKENLFDTFVEKMVGYAKKLVLGDPKSENTDISALINPGETDRIEGWIEEAVNGGAIVAYGGKRLGTVMEPTILLNGGKNLSISCN